MLPENFDEFGEQKIAPQNFEKIDAPDLTPSPDRNEKLLLKLAPLAASAIPSKILKHRLL